MIVKCFKAESVDEIQETQGRLEKQKGEFEEKLADIKVSPAFEIFFFPYQIRKYSTKLLIVTGHCVKLTIPTNNWNFLFRILFS